MAVLQAAEYQDTLPPRLNPVTAILCGSTHAHARRRTSTPIMHWPKGRISFSAVPHCAW